MSQDIVSDCLNQIMNAKKARKDTIVIKRYSKFLLSLLEVIKKLGYIDYKIEGKELHIEIKDLNECKAIKPRFSVSVEDIEKYVRRYLPARDFGFLIVSTNQGLLTHNEAVEKKLGGSLIAYVF